MKKKLIYLLLLVCPIGILSANNTTRGWSAQVNKFKRSKMVRKCPQQIQETNFELGVGTWLL